MIKGKKSLKASTPSRRKFFKAAAVTGAAAATAVAMPSIATADGHVTLKMQAAWPSGANIFF
ncbi:twin-arginine translocation signal domain-containing protein [Candidatus Pelagibacter sp.]|nr:twin-arginine translocation signal domain-containing protein [Candidatus Pelagibacter sp.]